MRIKVEAKMDRMGFIIIHPVSAKHEEKFVKFVEENGGPDMSEGILFQSGLNVDEFLEDCSPRIRKDIEAGWTVTFLVDSWIVGNWYGYDACNCKL